MQNSFSATCRASIGSRLGDELFVMQPVSDWNGELAEQRSAVTWSRDLSERTYMLAVCVVLNRGRCICREVVID